MRGLGKMFNKFNGFNDFTHIVINWVTRYLVTDTGNNIVTDTGNRIIMRERV